MKKKVKIKDIALYSKGTQINGDELLEEAKFDYLNGGIKPSGKWDNANCVANTVTISEGGNSCGYVNFMKNPFWCGAHCYFLYDTKIDSKYLYYALKSQQVRIMKLRSGACMPNIKKTDLGNFEFVCDDNSIEQKKITHILDKLECVIEQRKNEIQVFDELVKARFIEMFGEPSNERFQKKKLKETCRVITGNTPSRAITDYYGTHIEWVKTDNIVSGKINPTKATEGLSQKGEKVGRVVEKDAILMVCIAGSVASIGRVCITNRKVSFNQQINAVVTDEYNVIFLYVLFQLSKTYLVSELNMSLKGILSKSKLEDKEFIMPPIEMQNEFADFVMQIAKSKLQVYQCIVAN